MKKFYAPEISIEMYDVEDIITASAVTPTMSMADDAKKADILKAEDAGLTLAGVEW